MKEYSRHILFCGGSDCDGKDLQKAAKKHLKKDAIRVKCTRVGCLGGCKKGPLVIVYPDGVWYRCPNKKALEQIIDEHVKGGKVVEKYMLYQMQNPQAAPVR